MNIEEQLSRLLSGDLDEAEATALRARIATEPQVAEAWRRMRDLGAELDALPLPRLPAALVDTVVASPGRRRSPMWGAVAIAAAALLVLPWLRTPTPTRITLSPGSHLIDGNALVSVGDDTVTIDGRARLELAEEEPMKLAVAGAAAGALLTVAVYEGSARIAGPSGEVQLAAGEDWQAPPPTAVKRVVHGGAPSGPVVSVATLDECKQSVDELSAGLEQAQMEAAFLRGQLATHEGDPVPWPADVPEALLPDNLEAAFVDAFEGIGAIVSMDCEEYPCIVVVDEGAEPVPDAWKQALEKIEGQVGDVNAMVGRAETDGDDGAHTLGAYAISAATGEPPGPRTRFRLDQAMQDFGHE
ncbi:MAG: hypothetical protein EP330_25600 [Deltaproteobacteria bacterium]|nr:MAG: hypothetical protein EP330_25600 [Deltaproteobacteria bacterium]